MTTPLYCETCGSPLGECPCAYSREATISSALGRSPSAPPPEHRDDGHVVVVAGRAARMVREPDGWFVVHFDSGSYAPFRGRGLPSQVIADAADYVRRIDVERALASGSRS